ncbi:MAG: hypothetical protein KC731_24895 [Myxococcales bacterium]|nr:hypothetical protein [Myxococcales bacterium]
MRILVALAALLAAFALAGSAGAYCRSSNCAGDEGARCFPESTRPKPPYALEDCGTPIYWAKSCIGLSLHDSGYSKLPFPALRGALHTAMATWRSIDCDGFPPSLYAYDAGAVECGAAEYNQDAGNANVITFREEVWAHDPAALALTTVTFDVESSEIYDADIEVNAVDHVFTLAGLPDLYDFQSTLTHEIGHVFGLSHSSYEDDGGMAVMKPELLPGEQLPPGVSADDAVGLCAVSEAVGAVSRVCLPSARHGMASQCRADQLAGCSFREAEPRGGGAGGLLLLVSVLFARGLTRRRRECGPSPSSGRGRARRSDASTSLAEKG